MLFSQTDYQRLAHPRRSFVEFVHGWRTAMGEQGTVFPDKQGFEGLRDQGERSAPDLG